MAGKFLYEPHYCDRPDNALVGAVWECECGDRFLCGSFGWQYLSPGDFNIETMQLTDQYFDSLKLRNKERLEWLYQVEENKSLIQRIRDWF
jgi:hypothetical protein